MQFKNKTFQKLWRFATSFQLGIPVIASIMILSIWGTIVESRYDAWTAQKVVYQSWWMYISMTLLVFNLTIVMIDRLPWKKNHYPFILVHIGIITIVLGGWITQKFGIDGSMRVPIGKSHNMVTVPPTDFSVYATFDGERYTKIYDREVDFFNSNISESRPVVFDLNYGTSPDSNQLKVLKYYPYARASQKVIPTDEIAAGSSIRFQLMNAQVKQIESLTQQNKNKVAETTLGLLNLYLGYNVDVLGRKNPQSNEAYFNSIDKQYLSFSFYNKDNPKPYQTGKIKIGDVIQTQWMGLEVRLLDYNEKAKSLWEVIPTDYPTALTTSAIQISMGKNTEWILLNDTVKIFTDNVAYIVAYHNRQLPLDFKIHVNKFEIEKYQGTERAKEYSSLVTVDDPLYSSAEPILISMNEPLKYRGYTFYQASFDLDENTGQPVASIFSVNRDPGRTTKYLGSIIFSLGIVWLFYQRRKRRTAI